MAASMQAFRVSSLAKKNPGLLAEPGLRGEGEGA
jgi:hypothetical protein